MPIHLGIETKVIGNDWQAAIDVAVKLANKLNITILVNYANQYKFIIFITRIFICCNIRHKYYIIVFHFLSLIKDKSLYVDF